MNNHIHFENKTSIDEHSKFPFALEINRLLQPLRRLRGIVAIAILNWQARIQTGRSLKDARTLQELSNELSVLPTDERRGLIIDDNPNTPK